MVVPPGRLTVTLASIQRISWLVPCGGPIPRSLAKIATLGGCVLKEALTVQAVLKERSDISTLLKLKCGQGLLYKSLGCGRGDWREEQGSIH